MYFPWWLEILGVAAGGCTSYIRVVLSLILLIYFKVIYLRVKPQNGTKISLWLAEFGILFVLNYREQVVGVPCKRFTDWFPGVLDFKTKLILVILKMFLKLTGKKKKENKD